MAGGMAFGSTVGVLLEPVVGWQGVFLGVSGFGLLLLILLQPYVSVLGDRRSTGALSLGPVLTGYRDLLSTSRGLRTYLYVLVNAIFHSGVFTWLGLYFAQRYGLGEVGIGLACSDMEYRDFFSARLSGTVPTAGVGAGFCRLELPSQHSRRPH